MIKDLTGQFFGMYEVIAYSHIDKKCKQTMWECLCHLCNEKHIVHGSSLRQGKSTCCNKCAPKYRESINHEQKLIGIKMRKEAGEVVDKYIKQFKEPLRTLYQAYKKKSRAEAHCAVNDMVKIFKQFEEENNTNLEEAQG